MSFGRWSGFTEPGETSEDTARREMLEEAGIVPGELSLFRVFAGRELFNEYPNGDQVFNFTVAYLARDWKGEVKIDSREITEAAFFPLESLPERISPPLRPVVSVFVEWFRGCGGAPGPNTAGSLAPRATHHRLTERAGSEPA